MRIVIGLGGNVPTGCFGVQTGGVDSAGGIGCRHFRDRVDGPEGSGGSSFCAKNRPAGGDRVARRDRRDGGGKMRQERGRVDSRIGADPAG